MTTGIIKQMIETVDRVIDDESKAKAVVFAIMKEYGGERLYIPANDYVSRNAEIRELHAAGLTPEQLARRYRLSVRTIGRIVG